MLFNPEIRMRIRAFSRDFIVFPKARNEYIRFLFYTWMFALLDMKRMKWSYAEILFIRACLIFPMSIYTNMHSILA